MGLSYNPNARAEWPINVLQKRMAIKLEKKEGIDRSTGGNRQKGKAKTRDRLPKNCGTYVINLV